MVDAGSQVRYFALNMFQSARVISRMMSHIVEAMRFLGPEHCAISIFAERPDDGTNEILTELKPRLEAIGAPFLLSTEVKPVELMTRQEVQSHCEDM